MDDEKTVWCGNLSDKVTEELLFELFLQVAPLERVKIPTDKEGRKSNFGFITFKHQESVEYALQLLNGIRLFDKHINVKPRNANSNNVNRFIEKNLNQDTSYKGTNVSQNNNFPNRENRDNRYTPRSFRNNYRDDRHRNNSYNRHDERDRYDSDRRKQNYDRRDNFKDRGSNKRGNRYY